MLTYGCQSFASASPNPDRPASRCRVSETVSAPMRGTARQIEWAGRIRNQFASCQIRAFRAAFAEIVDRHPYAGWWIERRDRSLSDLLREHLGCASYVSSMGLMQMLGTRRG